MNAAPGKLRHPNVASLSKYLLRKFGTRQVLNNEPREWLTINAAAAHLNCSRGTIRYLISASALETKKLSNVRSHGTRIFISVQSINDFIRQCHAQKNLLRYRQPKSERYPWPLALGSIPANMTIPTAAQALRCSRSSVRRMIYDGRLRARRRSPYRW